MIDLSEQKGWRVSKDEDGEYRILGKFGEIHSYGDTEIEVWVHAFQQTDVAYRKAERRSNRMEREGWKAKQHYDDGGLFIKTMADLDKACFYIKASKKRKVTEAMREAGRRHVGNILRKPNPMEQVEPG